MNRSAFRFPMPDERLEWTGERYVSGLGGQIEHEHYHRYLFSLGFCEGKSVLDIACGEGYGSCLLGQVAASVIGVDIDRRVIAWANRQYLNERVSFRQGDATALPIDSCSIDIVVSFETIEHIAGQEQFVDEVLRVMRPGGLFILSSPNQPVYSGETGEVNPFHVHELDKTQFLGLLSPRFSHVTLFEQQTLMGSVIVGTGQTSHDSVERFDSPDGTLVERFADESRAMYFVAIASQGPIPAKASSVFHSPRYHLDEIGNRERKIGELERTRAETQSVVDERGERIAELERLAEERERARTEAQRVVEERERARAEAQSVVDERGERIAELERLAEERGERISALDGLYNDVQRLAEERERARAEAQRVVDERGERIAELERLAEERGDKLAELKRARAEAQRVVDERGEKIEELSQKLGDNDEANAELTCAVADLAVRLEKTNAQFALIMSERDAISASTLWQLTRPVRWGGRFVPTGVRRFIRGSIRALWRAVRFQAPFRSSPVSSG